MLLYFQVLYSAKTQLPKGFNFDRYRIFVVIVFLVSFLVCDSSFYVSSMIGTRYEESFVHRGLNQKVGNRRKHKQKCLLSNPKANPELTQTSEMELFEKTVND